MSETAACSPRTVVVMPDVLGLSVRDPDCRQILEGWRDGTLRWVVSRWLLVRYLRLLGRLGLSPQLLRWWGWWLSSPAKVDYVDDAGVGSDPLRICLDLAHRSGAEAIVCARTPAGLDRLSEAEVRCWVRASDFIRSPESGPFRPG